MPIKRPISKPPAVSIIMDSSSAICHIPSGITLGMRTVSSRPIGMLRIHNIEIGNIRRKAIHWAKLIGIEMNSIVPRNPGNGEKFGKTNIHIPRAPNPSIFITIQIMNGLFMKAEFSDTANLLSCRCTYRTEPGQSGISRQNSRQSRP